ncbi:PorP/SprF family type IX secretion system membrane protein [Galbibacter sp. BG1]|uniref:PorP/SprF family type IX secretion system membrane protein n=1 Tax=Galbibacter sp. BG1 TaxID=1170699 RepID=UPI0015B9D505|nr:PorP/SprF family type IX secretion system membrane protein [Galbibacter sp. BG1]QLE03020.1 PorP/SprF family type IX secretion system membrane protein [Galbibacter sp. BG1]
MAKKYLLTFGLLLMSYVLFSQVENRSATVDWRQQNLTKYNRFLVNPTFSIVRNDTKAVSFWSRIQWTGIDNSPQTYLLSYSGKVGERSGAGLGLYQQNLGLLTDSGLLLNYAYSVPFSDETSLTVGLNSTLFRRGLNKNAINSTEPDPAVLENQDDFLLLVMPGINLSIDKFDIGFYAENLFDYNFNDSNTVTDFSNKIFSGQLAYSKSFDRAIGFMEDAVWRTMVYGKTLPNEDFQFGFNSIIDLPYTGWFQAGYNTNYGIAAGLGVKIGEGISVGIVYENGTSNTNNSFGATYEAIATIELGPREMRKNQAATGGKAVTTKNVNEEDFISSEELRRKREEDAERISSSNASEAIASENTNKEIDEKTTSKYALYGGEATSEKEQDEVADSGKAVDTESKSEKSTKTAASEKSDTNKYALYAGTATEKASEENKGKTDGGKEGNTGTIKNLDTVDEYQTANTSEDKIQQSTDVEEYVSADVKNQKSKETSAAEEIAEYPVVNNATTAPKSTVSEAATGSESGVSKATEKADADEYNQAVTTKGEDSAKEYTAVKSEAAVVYEADAEEYAKAAQEQFNKTANKTVEAETKQENATVTEEEQIEAEYQEFLKRSDSIANTLDSKSIDSTAVTAEIFGKDTSYKTINSAPGIEKGFYLVVNVFSQANYFNDFVDDLRNRGFEPKFFINPENDYYYVYLYKADRYLTIKSLQRNNVNDTYFADKWVLWVK